VTTPRPSLRVDVVESPGPDEAAAVDQLLAAAEASNGYPSISEQARLDAEPRTERRGACTLLAWSGSSGDADLVGLGILERAAGRWTLETAVDPARPDDAGPVELSLLARGVNHAARAGGGAVAVWVRGAGAAHEERQWLTANGFVPVRQLLQLAAPLPISQGRRPQDRPLDVRPFHPGRDEGAWLEVNRRAFAGHPEQGSWALADLERRERAPWFDPGGFLVHEVDRRMAGFCWTKVHRTPVVGEIYVIGVDPDFQGRGLGRALTLAGLDHLATRGVPDAMLYVEASNVAALALYRSLGFVEHHRETVYQADVEATEGAET
jgi:mycothiol synthase